jgi:hypothetical protein
MPYRLIRYRTRPERAEENQRLIESVFAELRAQGRDDVRYLVVRGPDGAFFHLVAVPPGGGTSPVTELPAFQEFQRGVRERTLEPPEVVEVTLVGNHRMLSP